MVEVGNDDGWPAVRVGRFAMVAATAEELGVLADRAAHAVRALLDGGAAATAKSWLGFRMAESPGSAPDFTMVAVSALGDDRDRLTSAWAELTPGLQGTERYDVEVEPVRATGTGWGVEVDTSQVPPLGPDEPVMTVITGDLHPQHVGAFVTAAGPAVAQAYADPDYLGGCGLVSEKRVDITSVSCWASARAARAYAYRTGAHRAAKDADETGGWHDWSTVFFATYRPLATSGTLLGTDPFAAR